MEPSTNPEDWHTQDQYRIPLCNIKYKLLIITSKRKIIVFHQTVGRNQNQCNSLRNNNKKYYTIIQIGWFIYCINIDFFLSIPINNIYYFFHEFPICQSSCILLCCYCYNSEINVFKMAKDSWSMMFLYKGQCFHHYQNIFVLLVMFLYGYG